MVYMEKSQPAPGCLVVEKQKADGDYKCGDVLERLWTDFHNKCYICEEKAPSSINVEHFIPHKDDLDLKFDWNNLFFSCGHCNNTKLAKYDNILNCTDKADSISTRLAFLLNPWPKETVKIDALDSDEKTVATKELLEAVYNGTTKLKILESSNIRNKLLKERDGFEECIKKYQIEGLADDEKEYYRNQIISHLHPSSAFTAFKREIVKNHSFLWEEFGKYCS